ncbi:hypothetical protein [Sulfitobacter sp. M22]|uniref:hypothetical protein n=1 Tax=Sulfitobacter sp. M22 TaxID=2675332 RepID=UPI001F22746F|nr:hypothetical protein [Sulfitobacter sp. M22]MCF7725789.1 hypothetical protein [Sulfitobacter sp. M22]
MGIQKGIISGRPVVSRGLGISRGVLLRPDGGGFFPASLFANGEQGAWYDPSDLSTLFQDAAGTVPVTAAGQPVGLMLDKSQGLALGPELITNGTFDTDLTGFSAGASWSWADGKASASGAATLDDALIQNGVVPAGEWVEISFDLEVFSGALDVRSGTTGGAEYFTALSVSGQYTRIFKNPLSETAYNLRFNRNSGVGAFSGTLDNISVRELPGNHAVQTIAAARPTYQTDGTLHWLEFDGVDDSMVTPTITPGTDKVQVFAGVRKLSPSTAIITELSSSSMSNNGTFAIISNTRYEFRSRGAVTSDVVSPAGQSLPANSVITGIGDISADISTIRLDGSSNTSPADQGLGDYLAYPLYIGARSGPLVPFKGDLFGLTVRFGPALDVSIIESTEADLAAKTGVTL